MIGFNQQFTSKQPLFNDTPSPWLQETLRRRAEEAAKPKPFKRHAVQPKQAPKPRSTVRADRTPLPVCGCGNRMYRDRTTCFKCEYAVRNQDRRVCSHEGCYFLLQRNNKLGLCEEHAVKAKRKIQYANRKARLAAFKPKEQ